MRMDPYTNKHVNILLKEAKKGDDIGSILELGIYYYHNEDYINSAKMFNISKKIKKHEFYYEYIKLILLKLENDNKKLLKVLNILDADRYDFEIKILERKISESSLIYKFKKWYKENINIIE